jgi:hypothetical protein
MKRYWALRTDQSRREFMWRELREGRLRQGLGIGPVASATLLLGVPPEGRAMPSW